MRKIKKLVATLLAATMLLAMGVTAFAATPTTCKFTKADGSDLKLKMGTALIDSCDLDEDGIATVTFKAYSVAGYKGTITDLSGDAVLSWDADTSTAVIDMNQASSETAGVPVTITFKFTLNLTPPGMSNPMDAMFVCY